MKRGHGSRSTHILAAACLVAALAAPALQAEEPSPPAGEETGAPPPGGEAPPPAAGEAPAPPVPDAPPVRDVPPAPLPGIETVPRGLSPSSWRTWAMDQDVSSLPRINLRLSSAFAGTVSNMAGSGQDAPLYEEIFEPGPMLTLEFGWTLTPTLELALGSFYMSQGGKEYEAEISGIHQWYDFEDLNAFGFFLAAKIRLPLWYSSRRLFRFSRAEAVTGFSLVCTLGAGFVHIDDVGVEYEDPPMSGFWTWKTYFDSSENPVLLGRLGLEYRFVNFAIFVDGGAMDLGTPTPSSDPAWAEDSKADSLFVPVFHVGISIQF